MAKVAEPLREFADGITDDLDDDTYWMRDELYRIADQIDRELEGDGVDLCAILLDVELPDGTSESRRYVPERTTKRISVPRESHVALGHYECGECGTVVDTSDRYCRGCGAELGDE